MWALVCRRLHAQAAPMTLVDTKLLHYHSPLSSEYRSPLRTQNVCFAITTINDAFSSLYTNIMTGMDRCRVHSQYLMSSYGLWISRGQRSSGMPMSKSYIVVHGFNITMIYIYGKCLMNYYNIRISWSWSPSEIPRTEKLNVKNDMYEIWDMMKQERLCVIYKPLPDNLFLP